MLILSLLLACNGCASCQPELPNPDSTDTQDSDTQDVNDSGSDTGEDTGDTGFVPPPCPIMELEPNDSYTTAQLVLLEKWICGDFNKEFDLDNYGFQFPAEEGWLKIWGRGQSVGSLSDLLITLDQGTNTAISFAQAGSTDPFLLIPVTNEDVLYATMQDQYGEFGEDNFYEMLISEVKPPVEWNDEESDSFGENNSPAGAHLLQDGSRVFGRTATNTDTDWYRISVPEGQSVQITISIEAFQYGSPIDPIIYLYPEAAFTDSSTAYVAVRNNGSTSGNLDPTLRYTLSEGGEWALLLKNNTSGGSDFHWYVMDVQINQVE